LFTEVEAGALSKSAAAICRNQPLDGGLHRLAFIAAATTVATLNAADQSSSMIYNKLWLVEAADELLSHAGATS